MAHTTEFHCQICRKNKKSLISFKGVDFGKDKTSMYDVTCGIMRSSNLFCEYYPKKMPPNYFKVEAAMPII